MTGTVRHRIREPVFQLKIMEAKILSRKFKLRADGGPDRPGSRFAGGEAGLDTRVRNALSFLILLHVVGKVECAQMLASKCAICACRKDRSVEVLDPRSQPPGSTFRSALGQSFTVLAEAFDEEGPSARLACPS